MEKRVLTVLRGGGEYGPQHVQAIQRQVAKWAPGAHVVCLSDTDVPGVECIPLMHDWPGWWAKLELFRYDVPDDFLYTDLDNVIFGSIDEFAFDTKFVADIGFSFFHMTADVKWECVYEEFARDPVAHMAEWDPATRRDGKFGDAAFLRHRCGLIPAKWDPKFVTNVESIHPPCPWRAAPPRIPPDLRVLLCGGAVRRPWLSASPKVREAYWCK